MSCHLCLIYKQHLFPIYPFWTYDETLTISLVTLAKYFHPKKIRKSVTLVMNQPPTYSTFQSSQLSIIVGYCLIQHMIIYKQNQRILPHVVSTLVKTMLNRRWILAFGTQKCWIRQHPTVCMSLKLRILSTSILEFRSWYLKIIKTNQNEFTSRGMHMGRIL